MSEPVWMPDDPGNEDEGRELLMELARSNVAASDPPATLKECGCGPGDMCTTCTEPGVFAVAFMRALSAQIREGSDA